MTHELDSNEHAGDWVTKIDEHLKKYEFQRTKEAIRRVEEIKVGTWMPDRQTVDVCIKVANQWLVYFDQPQEFMYRLREVGNTYQIFQGRDNPKKEEPTDQEPSGV